MLELRRFTPARVGLGRAGNSIPTRELLNFQAAHAQARDAVHHPFDATELAARIEALGLPTRIVESAASDRTEYLRRPDLGRRLSASSRSAIEELAGSYDVVFIAADGLSPLAVQLQSVPLLQVLLSALTPAEWRIAPVIVASRSRVALSDDIGSAMGAALAVMLIGERPGLSACDSMGIYLTWGPRPGRTDADRNCISNIRPQGLEIEAAAETLLRLMKLARANRLSGVSLHLDKEDAKSLPGLPVRTNHGNASDSPS